MAAITSKVISKSVLPLGGTITDHKFHALIHWTVLDQCDKSHNNSLRDSMGCHRHKEGEIIKIIIINQYF